MSSMIASPTRQNDSNSIAAPVQTKENLAVLGRALDLRAGLGDSLSVRIADWCMHEYPELCGDWNCAWGFVLEGFHQVWRDTGEGKYLTYIKNNVDLFVDTTGRIRTYHAESYNLEALNAGRALFHLYQVLGEAKYKQAIERLRKQLKNQPRTREGGFWHNKHSPFQMWLDDAYMAGPFYAEYAKTFGEPAIFDDAAHQLLLMEKHMRDPETGLFYAAWDESKLQAWAHPQSGSDSQVSARAMGWYAMALVDVLEFLPPLHQTRDRIITILVRIIHALTHTQDPTTGLWIHSLVRSGSDSDVFDVSAACMFVYTMLKGFRMGLLDFGILTVANKAFDGVLEYLTKHVAESDMNTLTHQAARSAPSPLPEVGSLLLASIEMQRLSKHAQTWQ